ncbi:hypothetical protein [Streptomyces prunicolor]|uniref:hypothetical protein n=1 Tax=Streptomyces prunicolor TaxID=67348 RepID=UPI0003632070|nr:hypothetical protein [Streptomyces prunicolor]
MTNPRNREQDRAVRQYKRDHPGITLDQARQAVAARSGQQSLPARIPAAPLPRPAERLEGYIQRVAATAGVQRHRAMELLGLAPGTSATERLDELAAGPLPDHAVQALVAATGMTADQARALTTPLPARPDLATVRRMTETPFTAGHFRRGGEGKTSTSTDLAAALSLAFAQQANMTDLDPLITPGEPPTDAHELARLLAEARQRPLLIDTDPARDLTWTSPASTPVHELLQTPYTPVFVDLDRPTDTVRPPIDPEVFDEVAKALGIEQDTDTDAPPRE